MAESNAWMEYINQILNKMDYNTNTYTITGVCDAAAIYGQDGSAWAWSPNFPELSLRDFKIEGMTDADTKIVKVDEFQCALKSSEGNRNPSEAGIIFDGIKYMFVARDDTTGLTQLSKRGGGGAALIKTNTALIIAFWVKDKPMSNKQV